MKHQPPKPPQHLGVPREMYQQEQEQHNLLQPPQQLGEPRVGKLGENQPFQLKGHRGL